MPCIVYPRAITHTQRKIAIDMSSYVCLPPPSAGAVIHIQNEKLLF